MRGVQHIPKNTKTAASPTDVVYLHTQSTSPIWPIDGTLSGATTPGQSGSECNGNEGYSTFPKPPGCSLSIRLFRVKQDIRLVAGILASFQRCNWYILQPQQTELTRNDRYHIYVCICGCLAICIIIIKSFFLNNSFRNVFLFTVDLL